MQFGCASLPARHAGRVRGNTRRAGLGMTVRSSLPARVKAPLVIPAKPNETWSADFMSDALWSGRRFGTFNVIDDCAREALRIEIDTNLPAGQDVRRLPEPSPGRPESPRSIRVS
jgi:putative transposase